MLKLSCNATDKLQTLFSHSHQPDPAHRRTVSSVSCSHLRKPVLDPLRATVSADQGSVIRAEQGLGTLADQLRLGSLTEDGLSYKEKFIVRSYEVGSNKTATVETVANLLQVRLYYVVFFFLIFFDWMIGLVFSNVTHMSYFFFLFLNIINSLYEWKKVPIFVIMNLDWSIVKDKNFVGWLMCI